MKRFTKILTVVLILAVCIGTIPATEISAKKKSKNIYFAGRYEKKIKGGEKYRIDINQYSSPEGKTVGNFEILYYSPYSKSWHNWGGGEIKRIGKNKYKYKKYRFTIYKKKLVLKKAGDLNGTYKLKKRFYS